MAIADQPQQGDSVSFFKRALSRRGFGSLLVWIVLCLGFDNFNGGPRGLVRVEVRTAAHDWRASL